MHKNVHLPIIRLLFTKIIRDLLRSIHQDVAIDQYLYNLIYTEHC